MGEPGTKETLSLAELEAATSLRTGRKHVLSILVENKKCGWYPGFGQHHP